MRQLQLFTQAALAQMRDRTAARNYSPEREAFRREHERRRAWGLAQRHSERLRRRRTRPAASPAAGPRGDRQPGTTRHSPAGSVSAPRAQQQHCAMTRNAPTGHEPARRRESATDAAAPARKGRPTHTGQGGDRHHAQSSQRPASVSRGLTPTRSPLHSPKQIPCQSQPHHRTPVNETNTFAIDVAPRLASPHSDTPPKRCENRQPATEPAPMEAPTISSTERATLVRTRDPPLSPIRGNPRPFSYAGGTVKQAVQLLIKEKPGRHERRELPQWCTWQDGTAKGLTAGENAPHLAEVYGADVTADDLDDHRQGDRRYDRVAEPVPRFGLPGHRPGRRARQDPRWEGREPADLHAPWSAMRALVVATGSRVCPTRSRRPGPWSGTPAPGCLPMWPR
jgi:hypothetical protein